MVRMTLRKWLNQPMPYQFTMVESAVIPSTHESAETIDGWTRWEDFNMQAINALLGRVLDKTYELPALGTSFHAAHAVIGSEDALRWAVAQRSARIVNVALEVVSAAPDYHLVWGPGGACRSSSSRLHPDWSSVLSSSRLYDRTNLIAGESKMLPKDFPISSSSDQTSGLAEMERKRKFCERKNK
ncbi:hypothetical protein B0J12DRAFT_732182 [Macrophomina phaseolina]|uniref:Uncharacterized protein n=1 Tax=Macrophomina phaseolina TaxID=35725 RepID=A0ABQ8FWL4_9PEZI|nr:hypothetical protein B0J12DRAFT_732182 [Macrophomina phaseolina]